MSKITITDLIFSGTHGTTGREPFDTQRFGIDIEVEVDTTEAETSDKLRDTYDYKEAKNITKAIIEGERQVLIETLAARIADRICDAPRVLAATVTLRKLDASSNGEPAVTVHKKRTPQEQMDYLKDFDSTIVLRELVEHGGVSVPLLSEAYRVKLLEEALAYHYQEQPTIVGPNNVREELSSVKEFPPESQFWRLARDFELLFLRKLEHLGVSPFDRTLHFDELSLQKYEADSFGISPHKDFSSRINLIAVFVLTGKAEFALCDDKLGNNPRVLDGTPGNVILMRAPGFMTSFLKTDVRPMHVLRHIEEERIVFGLRQRVSEIVDVLSVTERRSEK